MEEKELEQIGDLRQTAIEADQTNLLSIVRDLFSLPAAGGDHPFTDKEETLYTLLLRLQTSPDLLIDLPDFPERLPFFNKDFVARRFSDWARRSGLKDPKDLYEDLPKDYWRSDRIVVFSPHVRELFYKGRNYPYTPRELTQYLAVAVHERLFIEHMLRKTASELEKHFRGFPTLGPEVILREYADFDRPIITGGYLGRVDGKDYIEIIFPGRSQLPEKNPFKTMDLLTYETGLSTFMHETIHRLTFPYFHREIPSDSLGKLDQGQTRYELLMFLGKRKDLAMFPTNSPLLLSLDEGIAYLGDLYVLGRRRDKATGQEREVLDSLIKERLKFHREVHSKRLIPKLHYSEGITIVRRLLRRTRVDNPLRLVQLIDLEKASMIDSHTYYRLVRGEDDVNSIIIRGG